MEQGKPDLLIQGHESLNGILMPGMGTAGSREKCDGYAPMATSEMPQSNRAEACGNAAVRPMPEGRTLRGTENMSRYLAGFIINILINMEESQ